MLQYETIFVGDPNLTDEETDVIVGLVDQITVAAGGKVASAFGALVKRSESLEPGPWRPDRTVQGPPFTVSPSIEELLHTYHIPTVPLRLAHSVEEATAIANDIGYPIVMKIASPDIPHK